MALLNNGSGTNLNTIPNPKCFSKLFDHSTGLHEVSSSFLPAVNLTNECYDNMFNYCEYLNSAPILPATTLADGCYQCMFQQCKSLATPIELPAEALTPNCYKFMFFNNKKLTSIKLNYEGNFEETYFYYWVHSVVSEGILYYNGSNTTIGYSAIPTNFKVEQFTKIDKK